MKMIFICIASFFTLFFSSLALSQQSYNWNSSPNNWANSPNNWDNNPNNWLNSPNNWNNNPNNLGSSNGVFDNRGNRIGYGVVTPSGVTNYFDNQGNRIGYAPAK